jgi:hypothetical protein
LYHALLPHPETSDARGALHPEQQCPNLLQSTTPQLGHFAASTDWMPAQSPRDATGLGAQIAPLVRALTATDMGL